MTNFLGYIAGGTEIASEETIRQQALIRAAAAAGRPRSDAPLDHTGEIFLTRWQPVAGYVADLRRDGATYRYIREAVRGRFGRVASHETIRKVAQYAETNPDWVTNFKES